MKKSFITLLIALISIALLGLIAIQMYWIQNAVALRDSQFRRNVMAAVSDVNKTLERREKINRLQKHGFARYLLQLDSAKTTEINQRRKKSKGLLERSSMQGDSMRDAAFAFRFDDSADRRNTNLTNENLDELIASEKRLFEAKLGEATELDGFRIREFGEMLYNILSIDASSDFLMRLDANEMDTLLKSALLDFGAISAGYHFGVFDEASDTRLMPDRSEPIADALKEKGYRIRLLGSDYGTPVTFLYIWFPDQEKYLVGTLRPLLISSGLFILTIILAFSFTISTILRQKKISEIKNDFINNMTHELKTPISTISLACEALRDPVMAKSADRVGKFVTMINDENKRLGALVENVLRSAVLDRSKLELAADEIEIHEVIATAIKNIALQAEQKGGEVSQELAAKEHIVLGDRIHLANVVYNLIDNAIKYSSGAPKIGVRTHSDPEAVYVEVSDTGIGIRKEDQKRIFDKLYRVPTGNIHNAKGFGLGLSYVSAIVQKHNGTVSVQSELGKGSIFTIQLPLL